MRAKPFSGKKKKIQLQEKRQRKKDANEDDEEFQAIDVTPGPKTNKTMETSFEAIYGSKEDLLSLPVRPTWSYEMGKEELDANERAYFKKWLDTIYSKCPESELSFFEHNLEVWRQLWRVCEISDVLVVVVDVRHPVLNFPPSLYAYIAETLKKPLCLALTKTDLVAEAVVIEWKEYIKASFPQVDLVDVSVYNLEEAQSKKAKRYVSASGVEDLFTLLRSHSKSEFHEEWDLFVSKRLQQHDIDHETDHAASNVLLGNKEYFTIGAIGHPNAGKSSLINSIVGKKVVSASRTPGHTKHFQTIHLSKHIRLCDCPGLIFPMRAPKWLQILTGLYNVAQVKDPYEPLLHLAQHIDLAGSVGLAPKERNMLQICEDYAVQRGFFTAKAARPDVYRAANFMLRSVVDGRILLSWKPPNYYDRHDEEVRTIINDVCSSETESDGSDDALFEGKSDENRMAPAGVGGGFGVLLQEDTD